MIGRLGAVLGVALSLVISPQPAAGPPVAPVAPAQPTEVLDQRTDSATMFRHPNGARTVVLSDGPVRSRQGADWTPVDLTLHRDPDGRIRPTAAPHPLWLSGGGPAGAGAAAVVRAPDGGTTTLDWATALPAPRLVGDRATYPGARPGADLVIQATRSGFVATLVPTSATPGPAGPGPALALRVSTPGRPDRTVPTASTPGAPTDPPGVLADTAVAGRVVASAITPTVRPFDTTVQNSAPERPRWADPDLRIGSYDGTTVARSFLTWDLTPLRGQQVEQATLRLYAEWSPSCRPQGFEVWSSQPVGPATRWANQPPGEREWASSTTTKGFGAGCAPGWTNVDVTGLVRSWVQSGAPSGTVLLRATDEASRLGWKRFSSGDGAEMPALGVTLAPATG